MSGMHPQFMLSKRFPVHTAIEMQDLTTLASLLSKAMDARFHFDRKLTNNEVSVLHQACCARTQPNQIWVDIVTVCLRLGAPVNDPDCIGQTPLFYAITHCQAKELVPLLLNAGANVNQPRWSDGWTVLHVAAMVGAKKVTSMLLQAGANTTIMDEDGGTAANLATRYGFSSLADTINKSPKSLFKHELIISKSSEDTQVKLKLKDDTKTKVYTNGINNHKNDSLDGMNEEVIWAMQMKREQEEAQKKAEQNKSLDDKNLVISPKKEEQKEKRKTQEERMREIKAKYEEEKKQKENPQQSQGEQLLNIAEVMERKRQRRLDARKKMTDKDKIEKEQAALREAMYDEIIWALELKKDMAEQSGLQEEVEKYSRLIQEEEDKKDGTWERRIKQAEKEKEEKKRQAELAVENEKLMAIQKEAEIKRAKENAAKMLVVQQKMEEEMQRKKEQEAFDRLPNWKKDKILREKRVAEEKILKEKREAEAKVLNEKKDEEEKILKEKQATEAKILNEKKEEEEKLLKANLLAEESEVQIMEAKKKIEEKEKQVETDRQLNEEKEQAKLLYKQQEAERIALENKRLEEIERVKKKAEEDARKIEDEQKLLVAKREKEEERRICEERKKQEEYAIRIAEEKKNQERINKAKEEVVREQEQIKIQEDKLKAEERKFKQREEERQLLNRVEERTKKRALEDAFQREEAKKIQEKKKKEEDEAIQIRERKRKEEKIKEEEEFNRKENERKINEEKHKAEEQAMILEEQKKLQEAKTKAEEEMKIQLERVEARRKRRAEEEAIRIKELTKLREERTKAKKHDREAEQQRIIQEGKRAAEEEEAKQKQALEIRKKKAEEEEEALHVEKEKHLAKLKSEEEANRKSNEDEEVMKIRLAENEAMRKNKEEDEIRKIKREEKEVETELLETKGQPEESKMHLLEYINENGDSQKCTQASKIEEEEDWADYDWEWEDEEPDNEIMTLDDQMNTSVNIYKNLEEIDQFIFDTATKETHDLETQCSASHGEVKDAKYDCTNKEANYDETVFLQNSRIQVEDFADNVHNYLEDVQETKNETARKETCYLGNQNNTTSNIHNSLKEVKESENSENTIKITQGSKAKYFESTENANDGKYKIKKQDVEINVLQHSTSEDGNLVDYNWEWEPESKTNVVADQNKIAVLFQNDIEVTNGRRMLEDVEPLLFQKPSFECDSEIQNNEDNPTLEKEVGEEEITNDGVNKETELGYENINKQKDINLVIEQEVCQMQTSIETPKCKSKVIKEVKTEKRIKEELERISEEESLRMQAEWKMYNEEAKQGCKVIKAETQGEDVECVTQKEEDNIHNSNKNKKAKHEHIAEYQRQDLADDEREKNAIEEKNSLQELIRIVQEKIKAARKEKELKSEENNSKEEDKQMEAGDSKLKNSKDSGVISEIDSNTLETNTFNNSFGINNNSHLIIESCKSITNGNESNPGSNRDLINKMNSIDPSVAIETEEPQYKNIETHITKLSVCEDIFNTNTFIQSELSETEEHNTVGEAQLTKGLIIVMDTIKTNESPSVNDASDIPLLSESKGLQTTKQGHVSETCKSNESHSIMECSSISEHHSLSDTIPNETKYVTGNEVYQTNCIYEDAKVHDKHSLGDLVLAPKDPNVVSETPFVPLRKKENKQIYSDMQINEEEWETKPNECPSVNQASHILPNSGSIDIQTTEQKSVSEMTNGTHSFTTFVTNNEAHQTTCISEDTKVCDKDSLSESNPKPNVHNSVYEAPIVPPRKKENSQKDNDIKVSESVEKDWDTKPFGGGLGDAEKSKKTDEIDRKNTEAEEKSRLERLINMVQEKINAARKKRQNEEGI